MLKAGQVLYAHDPRYRGRKVEVVRIEGSHAVCMSGPRQVKVRLDCIFSDGQPRRSGYSTVAEDLRDLRREVGIVWTEYLKETANGFEGREQRFNCIGIREEAVLIRIGGRHCS